MINFLNIMKQCYGQLPSLIILKNQCEKLKLEKNLLDLVVPRSV